jgi:acyl-CoA thioesterase FadM
MIHSAGEVWGVTIDLQVRFKKAVPLDQELRVIGRITKDSSRFFEGTGELLLADGTVAAEGHGKYLKAPLEKIADFDVDAQEWDVVRSDYDPESFEI